MNVAQKAGLTGRRWHAATTIRLYRHNRDGTFSGVSRLGAIRAERFASRRPPVLP